LEKKKLTQIFPPGWGREASSLRSREKRRKDAVGVQAKKKKGREERKKSRFYERGKEKR